ncbi:hypothetical protein D1007_06619 [Hordeum vulgare]|nr:hypothetical protein D1007_06619 [Hordeum vulgare]
MSFFRICVRRLISCPRTHAERHLWVAVEDALTDARSPGRRRRNVTSHSFIHSAAAGSLMLHSCASLPSCDFDEPKLKINGRFLVLESYPVICDSEVRSPTDPRSIVCDRSAGVCSDDMQSPAVSKSARRT